MIYLIVLILFILLFSIATIFLAMIKLYDQKRIRNKRIDALNHEILFNNDTNITLCISELYMKSYSHFFSYIVGHFSSILLDIYSIVLSIASLSMISSDISSELTQCISLLSTFFIITLVFSHLDERSLKHINSWRKCENIILNISLLMSNSTDIEITKKEIYSFISSYRDEGKSPLK